MRNLNFLLIGLLFAAVYAVAGGAASFVAKMIIPAYFEPPVRC